MLVKANMESEMRREKKASEENPCPFSVLVVSDVGKLAEIRAKNTHLC